METLGEIIDKLCTADLKMWNAQEKLYAIRRMSFDEFKSEYGTDEGLKILFDVFKKSCDLNYQRNYLMLDIDKKLIEVIKDVISGGDISKYVKDPHKTY